MIRMRFSDFKEMYQSPSYNSLYHALLQAGAKTEPGGEVIALDVDNLKGEAFRLSWNEWARSHPSKILGAATQPVAVIPAQPAEDGLARLQRERREAEEATEKARLEAANKRLNVYLHEQGLLNIDENVAVLKNWFQRNNAPYNAANLSLAVEQLAAELTWAVWSPRRAPVVEVRMLPNGEPELPIDCTEAQMRRSSKAQLQDLSVRRGEFRQNQKGWSGSSFITPTF